MIKKHRIGDMLLDYGLITREQLENALHKQAGEGGRIGSILEELGYLDNDMLLNTLGKQFDLPFVDLYEITVPGDILSLLTFDQVRSLKMLPFRKTDDAISFAMVSPDDAWAIQCIESAIGVTVKPFVVPFYQMDRAIERFETEGYANGMFEGDALKRQ